MCGIAGKINRSSNESDLQREALLVSGVLRHRGPDDAGFILLHNRGYSHHFSSDTDPDVRNLLINRNEESIESQSDNCYGYLLHRRLSILDLSPDAHQPMVSKEGKWLMVYNGEVYNYKSLRQELEQVGITFRSTGDSEVVLAAFTHWGTACFERFDGMFSIVLYHPEKKTFVFARDRAGVKPLYYALLSNTLYFASEQKAILCMRGFKPTLNVQAAGYFFLNPGFHEPFGDLFNGIKEFPNGSFGILNEANQSFKMVRFYADKPRTLKSLNESLKPELLYELVEKSVVSRLQSDVPVASCLSGGLDSSTLVCLAAKHVKNPMEVFCAVFPDMSFDESVYAKEVAEHTRSVFHAVHTHARGLATDLRDLIYSQDTPLWSTSTYAQYSVMRRVHQQGIKVVLDGQGSDELFAGYPSHYLAYWNELLNGFRWSELLTEQLSTPKQLANPKSWFKWNALRLGFNSESSFIRKRFLQRKFTDLNWIYEDFLNQTLSGLSDFIPGNLPDTLHDEFYNGRLRIYLKCEDRCSMRFSVEARTPFADDLNLIEAAGNMQSSKFINKGTNKHILRLAMKGVVPENILSRKDKLGYVTPNANWLDSMGDDAMELFKSADVPFFDTKSIEKEWKSAISGSGPDNGRLFRYLSFAVWYTIFFRNS